MAKHALPRCFNRLTRSRTPFVTRSPARPRHVSGKAEVKPTFMSGVINSTIRWTPYVVGFTLSAHIFASYFYMADPAWGISMLPTINSSGDILVISKYYRKGRSIGVGDVVSFRNPVLNGEYAVKRVVGMPGDFVLRDTPGHSPIMIQIPEGHCWVTGDNLKYSRDSRVFGCLPLALVSGKIVARVHLSWPFYQRIEHGLQPSEQEYSVD